MRRSALALGGTVVLAISSGTRAMVDPTEVAPLVRASEVGSPFAGAGPKGAPCDGVPDREQAGTNFPGTEVEPWVSVNPADGRTMVGGWQQDRWSNGGATANIAAFSVDGGRSWKLSGRQPQHARCTGGTPANGGDFERGSDPWTAISPDGTAYFMSLARDITRGSANAMLVSRSTDGGRTWGPTTVLRRDTAPARNDKNSITADRFDSRFVYAVWSRAVVPQSRAARRTGPPAGPTGFHGPTWFARTTDGGKTWRRARPIFDPGPGRQTLGNQIVQTGDGTLVNGFDLALDADQPVGRFKVAVQRSGNRGATFGAPVIVDGHVVAGVTDPTTGAAVPTGELFPLIAADPRAGSKTLYMTWQDGRATGGARSQIALAKSTDGGRSWHNVSYAINKVRGTHAFIPTINVLPDGTIGVLHYDFRHDTADVPLVTSTWLLRSGDGGRTWRETKVGEDFDIATAPQLSQGPFVGDYNGMGVAGGAFHPFFTVTGGTLGARSSDIVTTRVR